jgi:TolB-like protein
VSFISELRRRKVFRFGGIYVVGAWLVFQIADVFFPAWGVPDTALRYLLYAAVACFPVALVFSWFYDISTGGITRTLPVKGSESADFSLKRSDYLVLAGLFVVAGAILYNSFGRVVESAGEAPETVIATDKPTNSIAVLPFDNLDPDPDTGYFSDGVSEEILHRLSATQALKVIGRQSSFAFGGTDMGLDRISDILGVRYLLGGSIRRAGEQVRLTARLVNDSGYQLWSESFDGELTDIFAFQDEIAEQVASEITRQVVVLESPKSARTTESAEAYRQYLIGREYFHARTFGWQNRAAEAYRRSIETDPEFALPYTGLAIAIKMGASIEDPDSRWDRINGLIDKAMELHPDLPEGWMARGLTNTQQPGWDLEEDIEQLKRAIKLGPGLSTAYNFLAVALGWSGRPEESQQVLEKGLEVDPLNPALLINYADTVLASGDFAGWKGHLLNLLDLPEPPWRAYRILSNRHREYGLLAEALEWDKQLLLQSGKQSDFQLIDLALTYERLGMRDKADSWLDFLKQHKPEEPLDEYLELLLMLYRGDSAALQVMQDWGNSPDKPKLAVPGSPGAWLAAQVMIAGGDYVGGIALLETMVDLSAPLEVGNLDSEEFLRAHWLILAYRAVDQPAKAEAVLAYTERMLELLKVRVFWVEHPLSLMMPVLGHVVAEDLGSAATSLRVAVDGGWRDYYLEVNSPVWRGAWHSKEFAPMVADMLADLERQRAEVEATEAEHDFRAEFESLIAK